MLRKSFSEIEEIHKVSSTEKKFFDYEKKLKTYLQTSNFRKILYYK